MAGEAGGGGGGSGDNGVPITVKSYVKASKIFSDLEKVE